MSLSKVQFEKRVDDSLRKFADDLKADEEFYSEGIRQCEKVRNALEHATRNVRFTIASTYYGGSIGKGTDVQSPDFDIVMKINNHIPPFTDVLDFFKLTLQQQSFKLKITCQTIRLTPYSIQFSFTNGMAVDLLPAVAQLTEEQVLQKMKGSAKNRRYYSSSLVANQVKFMRQQSAFAHAVARLAKFWYKTMNIGYYVSGGSTIFENLAVAAVLEEGDNRPESMYSAFMRVVKMVENLGQLQLEFKTSGSDSWRVGDPIRSQQVPYLLEPANSTNNLLQGMQPHVKKILKNNARSMIGRLQNLIDKRDFCPSVTASGGVKIDFKKLFKRNR